jgi:hypothetical protein
MHKGATPVKMRKEPMPGPKPSYNFPLFALISGFRILQKKKYYGRSNTHAAFERYNDRGENCNLE